MLDNPNPEVEWLRELLDLRFGGVEQELSRLRSAIEKLTIDMVTSQQFEYVRAEVEALRNRVETAEKQIDKLESNWRIVRIIVVAMGAVLVPIVIAMLRNWLGI